MNAVRHIIDSNALDGVIVLPKLFHNKKVEIIVSLIEEELELPLLNKYDIDELLRGSVTESLIGSLQPSSISFNDYRAERLNKYERTD